MSDFTDLIDLAAERLGGAVLHANDEFFASKDNLLKAARPIFIEGKYTDRGKWMDGWETRRRRTPGHDFCLIRLGLPGVVRGVEVNTAFFRGNYPEACSIDACALPGHPGTEALLDEATGWFELLPRTPLEGDRANRFAVSSERRVTHLRLHIYPDGGVARLRVHGEVVPDPRWTRPSEVDLVSVEHGGEALLCSDMFFGVRGNLIMPGRGLDMGDGWETRRSRRPGPEWVVLKLGAEGTIARVEVDTTHFRGNAPESCSLAACRLPEGADPSDERLYAEILPRQKLMPHTRHFFEEEVLPHAPVTHARLCIFPDGGVSRLRLHGQVSPRGRIACGLRHLNSLSEAEAVRALLSSCGSPVWAREMAARRPYASLDALRQAADACFERLGRNDWLEAFASHPRIGETGAARAQGRLEAAWSAREQAGVAEADQALRDEIAAINREYEARFGHIYIVCASGRSAAELLALAQARLANSPDVELRTAAEEQRRITHLRLEKLLSP